MDNRAEIREFLMSRRAKITPTQAGLPPAGRRRVPGLRRIEVAMLAGVSVEYYSRLERGDAAGVSESILEAITGAPAIVHDGRLNHLAGNALGKALFSPFFATGEDQPNSARYTFLDPRAPEFLRDWDKAADDTVAILRAEAGRDPYDRNLSDLIGELSTRSEEFRARWAAHDVRIHTTGTKRLHHPVVGDLDLSYESFSMPDHGQNLLVYVTEPGTPSHDALALLASYAATDQLTGRSDATRERSGDRAD